MYSRRMRSGLTVADFSCEYIRMLPPWAVVTPWYMLGDHGYYSPIMFR